MIRRPLLAVLSIAVLAGGVTPLSAQLTGGVLSGRASNEPPIDPTKPRTVELVVHIPSLSTRPDMHALSFDAFDKRPGNAALIYLEALLLLRPMSTEELEAISDLFMAPLEKSNVDKAASLVDKQLADAYPYLALAARRESCDWETPVHDLGVNTFMPELGKLRSVSRALALKARVEMAREQIPQALDTLRTAMAIARHLGEGPTLIQALVGLALLGLTHETIDALIAQPGCPSLYWSLSELGAPLIDFTNAFNAEKTFIDTEFKELRAIHSGAMPPDQAVAAWQAFAVRIRTQFLNQTDDPDAITRASLEAASEALAMYPDARKHMASLHYTDADIDALPVSYVSLRYLLANFIAWREDMFKWTSLPYWQASPGIQRTLKKYESLTLVKDSALFTAFAPALVNNTDHWVASDRRQALLRCVEAVRLYAATNDGKLPSTLDDMLAIAPCPLDPVTGKAFAYRVEGDAAIITGETPAPRLNRVMVSQYTVRLTKTKP